MIIEDPLALPYIFADNVYLLPQDKALFNKPAREAAAHFPITETVAAPVITFNYTGRYQNKFLVLVHYSGHEAMEPAHLSALESALKRKELSLDDIAILNLNKAANCRFEDLMTFFTPKKMLILGESALPQELAAPPLNQLTKLGECDTLYSFAFNEMMGNKDNTKAFWEQMKVL